MNFGNKGDMTVRLTITKGDKTETILTGSSYKDWTTQAVEYIFRTYGSKDMGWRFKDVEDLDIEVEKSNSRWVGWGGLKWCSEDIFQKEELNREGCQENEPDNPKPRQYVSFVFDYYPVGYRKLMKELRQY